MKRNKIAFIITACSSLLVMCSLTPFIHNRGVSNFIVKSEDGGYVLTATEGSLADNVLTLTTQLGNEVKFTADNASTKDGYLISLGDDSYLLSQTKISGVSALTANFEGDLSLQFSTQGAIFSSPVNLVNEVEFVLPSEANYLKFMTDDGADILSLSINYSCEEANVSDDPILFTEYEFGPYHKNEVVSVDVMKLLDEKDSTLSKSDITLTVTDPSDVETPCTADSYKFLETGEYTFTYAVTDSLSNTASKSFTFEVKEKFVIAYDNRMYTKGVSGITPTIINNYLTYVKSELDATYDDVAIELQGFDNIETDDADVMADDIIAAGAELTVGFSTSTIGNGAKHIAAIESTECKIAGITKRFIARHSESDLAKVIYNISKTSNGISSLEVKKINVCWFENGSSAKSPLALRNAVDTALESYFEGLGYNIDVQSYVYQRTSTYQDVKDKVIADECVFGVNWATNFNLSNGFMFYNSRVNSGHVIQSQSNRCITGMVRKDDTRAFYNDAFDFLCSAEMDAIYNASY